MCIVVAFHLTDGVLCVLLPPLATVFRFLASISFRMDLFFILGGFILSYVYMARDEVMTAQVYKRFLWSRFIRIYPGHLAILLLLVFGVTAGRLFNLPITGPYPLEAIPWQLTLTQCWPFLSWAQFTWNYPAWFLSALWFGYLLAFPCAWKLAPKLRGTAFPYFFIFVPLLAWLAALYSPSLLEFRTLIRVSCELLSGSALFVLYLDHSRFVAAAQKHLDQIVLGFFILFFLRPVAPVVANALLILALPLLLAGTTDESSFTAKILATRPLMWLGTMSYSIFVSHALVERVLKIVLPAQRFAEAPLYLRALVLAVYAIAILGFALGLEKLFVLPCAKFMKHLGHPVRPQTSAAGVKAQPV